MPRKIEPKGTTGILLQVPNGTYDKYVEEQTKEKRKTGKKRALSAIMVDALTKAVK